MRKKIRFAVCCICLIMLFCACSNKKGDQYVSVHEGEEGKVMKEEVLERYKTMQQAMVDADTTILNEVISEGTTFRHMSGRVQKKEEYLKDIEDGVLDYRAYTIEDVSVTIDGEDAYVKAKVTLTANAYGTYGSWPFSVNAHFKRINSSWYSTN